MKKTILVLLMTMEMLAFAGTVGGGGGHGGAYQCAPDDVQLVDLWEAEVMGYKIDYSNPLSLELQLGAAVERVKQISPRMGEEVGDLINYLQDEKNLAGGPGVYIPPPDDVDPKYQKRDKDGKPCPLVGMMYFDDDYKKLVRDTNIYNKQKTTVDYTASLLHEAVWKWMRDNRVPASRDSKLARRIVACVLSDQDVGECLGLTKSTPLKGDVVWRCNLKNEIGKPMTITMIPRDWSNTEWAIQIDNYDGIEVLHKTNSVYYNGYSGSDSVIFPSPDAGAGGLAGMYGLGNVAAGMIQYLQVVEPVPHLKLKPRGSKESFACQSLGKPKVPDKEPPKKKRSSGIKTLP